MKRIVIASAALFLLGLCFAITPAQAQEADPVVLTATNNPLPSLQAAADFVRANPPVVLFNEVPNLDLQPDTRAQKGGPGLDRDPLLQQFSPSAPTTFLTQFDGSDNTDNGANVTPPDTDGDVSGDTVDRYVQMINIVTTVFDKSGNELGGGPFFSSAFWNNFGGFCETNDNGDPIVLYDETSQRWLVSQFAFDRDAFNNPAPPFLQCIAVSQTSDPLGAYNRYAFDFTSFGLNDYPKHGITTNAITMMANLFAPPSFPYVGTFLGVADKNCMYAGNPSCTLVGANIGASEGGFVAGDLDDPAGTAGFVPALFATAMTASGLFDVWEIVPDYVTPGNTTITRIERVPIASFDSDVCPATRERCVPHPGSGDDLETLSGRLMHRLQLRDFGTHLSMVASHTIDADVAPPGSNGRAGIRWYEVRSTDGGANWSLHQQGTHAPADGLDRWMPSIAMNDAGDIGIGYMVSSASMPVEIRVTGQTAGTSGSGTFDGDEEVCRAGVAGADWSGRSGDYSATNIDPDSDTFWHTNEFGRSTVLRGWGTAVCEFELSSGPFNQPPVVTINAPPNGSNFNQGDPVTFTGTATDNEDGIISSSISWSSDLDNNLGTGASVTCPGPSCSALSVGTHTITASVTDSGAPTANPKSDIDQITVTINPPPATDVHVENIVTGTQGNGSKKNGTATVTILDDLGNPAAGYSVTGVFSGDFNESQSGTTNASGVVTLVTSARVRNPVFSVCVSTVAGALPYDPNDNANPSFACGGGGNPPAAPSSLTATAVSSSQINLGWTDNANDEDGFQVERSLDGNNFSQIATVGANVTNYSDTGLSASTTYFYRVRAFNGNGNSGYSNTANATTQGGGTPTDVHVESIVTGTQNVGQGNKRGTATVTLRDDLGGNPGAGYTVMGDFGGDIVEPGASAVTNSSGVASFTTTGTARGGVSVTFCVSNVSGGSLPYDENDNTPGTTCSPSAAAKAGDVPVGYALEQNFPNPFNPSTVVAYSMAEAGAVTLKVYNVLGQEVATLVDGYTESGRHEVVFDASRLSAGVYLYVIEADGFTATQRMTLLK